ncbi:MAG: hypothetical protein IT373_31740 [Polyangiaceae bacterium]|nr:hypothetical protein [Polyangiaceae bacterium]
MPKPSYDDTTLAGYFGPVRPELYAHPVVGPVLRRLDAEDPDIVAAVADVDRSQVRDALARSPEERLRVALARWNGLARLRRGDGQG